MTFRFDFRRHMPQAGLFALMIAIAGCQSGGIGGILSPGGDKAEAEPERIERAELTAYCPQVTLRQGTAYYNTYAKAPAGEPQEDRSRIIYQASISEVTRSCQYAGEQLGITVAVAGRVVPGPKGQVGSVNLPLRIVVQRGEEVLYSQLHRHAVAIPSITGATQFVFTDPAVTVPAPDGRNLRIYAGFDEGPYDTP